MRGGKGIVLAFGSQLVATEYQEIATGLRPRNDSGGRRLVCMRRYCIPFGRWYCGTVMTVPYGFPCRAGGTAPADQPGQPPKVGSLRNPSKTMSLRGRRPWQSPDTQKRLRMRRRYAETPSPRIYKGGKRVRCLPLVRRFSQHSTRRLPRGFAPRNDRGGRYPPAADLVRKVSKTMSLRGPKGRGNLLICRIDNERAEDMQIPLAPRNFVWGGFFIVESSDFV